MSALQSKCISQRPYRYWAPHVTQCPVALSATPVSVSQRIMSMYPRFCRVYTRINSGSLAICPALTETSSPTDRVRQLHNYTQRCLTRMVVLRDNAARLVGAGLIVAGAILAGPLLGWWVLDVDFLLLFEECLCGSTCERSP